MPWPEFKPDVDRHQVTCPYCGRDIIYTHPPTGKGRNPPSLYNHLMNCRPGLTSRERYQIAEGIWAKRKAVG